MMTRLIAIAALAGLLAGCNTVAGVGQDITVGAQAVGNAMGAGGGGY